MELHEISLCQAHKLLKKSVISSVELTKAILTHLEKTESKLHTYLTVTPELALEQAELADKSISLGQAGPLTGIPAGIKDIICTKDIRTTCASRILENFIPPYDATLISHLKNAGMVMLGKHNMDEFAMGSSTENSAFGPTHNPWDLKAIPGGSSGGSAASVAIGSSFYSIGTDTGGSIRQPASHCGVVGMKPTYGRISRFGLIAFASSLDQAGPITKTVADLAEVLTVIAGHDPADSTSAPKPIPNYRTALTKNIKGLRLGIPKEYFITDIDPEVEAATKNALIELEKQGAELIEINLPHTEYSLAAYYIIAPAEASSNLARYDGIKYGLSIRKQPSNISNMYYQTRNYGFGLEVIRRIMLGNYALSTGYYNAYYAKASQVRTLVIRDFLNAFKKVDVIVGPVAPTPAFDLGQKSNNPIQMYLSDILTLSCNLAGLPGISIPCGFSFQNRPIGLQILGPYFAEETLIAIGHTFQLATNYHTKKPSL